MNLTNELKRKSLHFLLILVPILFCIFGKKLSMIILIPSTCLIVWLDYMRFKNQKIHDIFTKFFANILRPHELEERKLCGASYVALSACLNFLIFPKEIAVTGFVILVISDSLAAIIGKSIISQPFYEKSFAGSVAFFISATAVLIGLGIYFDVKFLFYFFGFFCALFVTILEARPSIFKIDDNFLIPTAFCLPMAFFNFMWNFL
jgi:dolichol kinase